MAESVDKMVINMDKAKQGGADLVEIRLDSLKSFNPNEDLKTLIKECPLPTLFTYRPKWEGGQYDHGDEKKRLDALRLAMEFGADYIDVELQAGLIVTGDTVSEHVDLPSSSLGTEEEDMEGLPEKGPISSSVPLEESNCPKAEMGDRIDASQAGGILPQEDVSEDIDLPSSSGPKKMLRTPLIWASWKFKNWRNQKFRSGNS
uniref:Uncharacterized protein n=1 Tax=Fagus sylvatica TaxID=28930 RepID=A0A2N9E7U6_FAGSY